MRWENLVPALGQATGDRLQYRRDWMKLMSLGGWAVSGDDQHGNVG